MSIYKKVKDLLPEHKSVVSDNEFLLLDRKDFHISQISAVNATLMALGTSPGYPFRVFLGLVDQFAAALRGKDFNLIVGDPSLTLAGFQFWMRAGGSAENGKTYAPKGLARFPEANDILAELTKNFIALADQRPKSKPGEERLDHFTLVLGNTKAADQTIFAVDRFIEIKYGALLLKDYAKVGAFDERDYLESKLVFPTTLFEGHALAMKL
jgi:hypothetical protein